MRFNWKVVLAAVVIVGVVFWTISSLTAKSYSGSNLTFGVGGGTVTLTNLSDAPVAASLVGTGSRGFSVSSNMDGVSGPSVREGSGNSATQTFLFDVPSGVSEFNVTSGTNVQFVSPSATALAATANPLSGDVTRASMIFMAVVILAALYFMSSATEHQWLMSRLGREAAPAAVAVAASDQGRATRSYGDNRADQ